MKRILVPVRGDGMGEVLLRFASRLAHRHKAQIVVAHCRVQPEDLLPYAGMMPSFARKTMVEQATELANQEEKALRADLHRLAMELDLKETEDPVSGYASVTFVEEFGRMADVIQHNGRLSDLIVVAQPDRDRNLGSNSLKSALFRTASPVLMCPRGQSPDEDFSARVAIAWNGSLEAARAVRLTLPMVAVADEVTILSGGKGVLHGATTDELIAYYRLRKIEAQVSWFESQNPQNVLVQKTIEANANLLIMGAYGHSHGHETLFGGNTQTIVDNSEIPVLMGH